MNRQFYFIGIAFFGMINGIFNQVALIFALVYVGRWPVRCCSAISR